MNAANTPGASIQRRINSVRFQLLGERNDGRRATLYHQLRSLASEALADKTNTEEFKLQTRIQLLYAEGCQCRFAVNECIARLNVQLSLSTSWAIPDEQPLLHALSAMSDWDVRMQQLIRDTEAAGASWLRAEARRNALLIRTETFGSQSFLAKFLAVGHGPSQSEAAPLLAEAKAVAELFDLAGDIAGEMRAKIAEADIHEIMGDIAAAKKIAAEVKVVADALALEEIGDLAKQHLTGTTILQQLEAAARKRRDEGPDVETAAMSDEEMDYFAEKCLSASQLPRERLPVIRRDVESMKLVSVERLNWCRHLEQIQNLFHSRHSLTAYAADPERFCRCKKHGYESVQGFTDPALVIARFKSAFCVDCPDRNPKVASSAR